MRSVRVFRRAMRWFDEKRVVVCISNQFVDFRFLSTTTVGALLRSVLSVPPQLPFVVRLNMCQIDMWRRREIECGCWLGRPHRLYPYRFKSPVSTNRLWLEDYTAKIHCAASTTAISQCVMQMHICIVKRNEYSVCCPFVMRIGWWCALRVLPAGS